MARTQTRVRLGSRATNAARHADAPEASARAGEATGDALVRVAPAAVVAAVLPAILPLTPGFSETDTGAAVLAAAVAAGGAVAIVPVTARVARALPASSAAGALVFAVALFSAAAAAIHFSVAKVHFDEYTLFGLFFVGSGVAQLVWPTWLLLRPWRPLLLLGAIGNGLIVVLWAVDRIWGLPLGPEHWSPDPVGFGDVAASSFEVLIVAGCLAMLTRGRDRPLSTSVATALALAVAAVTAASLLSILGVGSSILPPTE